MSFVLPRNRTLLVGRATCRTGSVKWRRSRSRGRGAEDGSGATDVTRLTEHQTSASPLLSEAEARP